MAAVRIDVSVPDADMTLMVFAAGVELACFGFWTAGVGLAREGLALATSITNASLDRELVVDDDGETGSAAGAAFGGAGIVFVSSLRNERKASKSGSSPVGTILIVIVSATIVAVVNWQLWTELGVEIMSNSELLQCSCRHTFIVMAFTF